MMTDQAKREVVSRQAWDRARAELLAREKAHTREGDQLAAARRRLPMTPVDDSTVLGAAGLVKMRDVFNHRPTLMVYHFMWKIGAPHEHQCEGCTHSQVAMHEQVLAYLADRGVTYAVFAMGPIDELQAYRAFMGYAAPWYSTIGVPELKTRDGGDLRVYQRAGAQICLTYENKWRGIEAMLPTLQMLDLTPLGRQETWEDSPAGTPQVKAGSWWRRDGRPIAQWTRTSEPAALKQVRP